MEADSEEVKEPTDFSSSNGKKAKEEEDEGFHFVHFADVESIIGEVRINVPRLCYASSTSAWWQDLLPI